MPIFHPLHATNLINILNIKFEYFNHPCMLACMCMGKNLIFRMMDECEPFQQHDDAKTHKLKTFGPSLHCNVMNVTSKTITLLLM
jgi:hypothetical protein